MAKHKPKRDADGHFQIYNTSTAVIHKDTENRLLSICNDRRLLKRIVWIAAVFKGHYEMERDAPTPGEVRAA